MKIVFSVGGLRSRASGLVSVMEALSAELVKLDHDVTLATAIGPNHNFRFEVAEGVDSVVSEGLWAGRLNWSSALKRELARLGQESDVFHNHDLWTLPCYYAYQAASKNNRPMIITPHGALHPWAVTRSWWKKRIARVLFATKCMQYASCIHALVDEEVGAIRAEGLKQPVVVIPNGVPGSILTHEYSGEGFLEAFPQFRQKKIVLFLSRIHQKKGLDNLIAAWSNLRLEFEGWHLVIAGPDDGYQQTVERQISEQGCGESVSLIGRLDGDAKYSAIAGSEVFVLPSYSEGFSMAILESLAMATPTLISDQCNFSEVEKVECGFVVEPVPKFVEKGLRALMEMTSEQRSEFGRRGRELIREKYTWEMISRQFERLYNWLLGGGSPPSELDMRLN